jgi:hypothetical protein
MDEDRDRYESNAYEVYLKALLAFCLANVFEEHAEKVREIIADRIRILSEIEELNKNLDALPPSNYLKKMTKVLELSTKLTKGLERVEDQELQLFLINTFNEYVEANNDATTEFLTQLELRRMDQLEHLVRPGRTAGGN